MLKVEELERVDLNMLAMYCLRVAESAAANPLQAEQARQLKSEWAVFIGHGHPPRPGLHSQEDIEAYGKELKQRMEGFLAGCPAGLFLGKKAAAAPYSNANQASAGSGK